MVRRVPRLLSSEWPPSTPIRLAVLFMPKAFRMSAGQTSEGSNGKRGRWRRCRRTSLTLTAGGKHEDFGVTLTHPVNHVYLLQRLSDCVFVLGVAGNVS